MTLVAHDRPRAADIPEHVERRRQARADAQAVLRHATRETLVDLLGGVHPTLYTPTWLAAAELELRRRYPCADCGAEAGSPCRHDYGCVTAMDRRPA